MLGVNLLKSANSFKTFLISSNVNDLSLAAVAGNPTIKGKFRFIVMPGVVVGQTQANGVGAMMLGTFPSGSEIEIINNGFIYGKGGLGGGTGTSGGAGGDALRVDYSQTVRITNNGEIRAGGGGGAGGGLGGAGSNGGRGNITGTTGWEQPRSDYEWYIFDAVPNDNHVSWPGLGWGDSNGSGETLMLSPIVLFEKGDYWGHTQDANPHNSWYVRYHGLQPGGAGAPANAGGAGGNGQGYNQGRTNGAAGLPGAAGGAGGNGAGPGGTSGPSGSGGNGGNWATAGTAGTNGSIGGVGGAGNAGGYPGGDIFVSAGGAAGTTGAGGAAGRAIVKGGSTVSYTDNGITSGAVV